MDPGLGEQALAGGILEQLAVAFLELRAAGIHALQRQADQHRDDGQQAEAAEQGDTPLDRQTVEGHVVLRENRLARTGVHARDGAGGRRPGVRAGPAMVLVQKKVPSTSCR